MTKGNQISLVGAPTFAESLTSPQQYNAQPIQFTGEPASLMGYADGGVIPNLDPRMSHGHPQFLENFTGNIAHPVTGLIPFQHHKEGGEMAYQDRTLPENHHPEFFSEGGLQSIHHRYVTGDGDGTSDSIPAMLANGEFVIPADVVSGLGNGSNEAGAHVLDEFLKTIRQHKRHADINHLPPDSKGPLGYLLEAKKKVK
jgi:hypothetical protein